MRRLAGLVRSTQNFIEKSVRGPKKKGQVQAKIQSTDIINIFKDRQDPQPRDIKQYPIFVQEMALGQSLTIHELLLGVQSNIKHMTPTRPYYKSFIRGIKRQRFKAIRQYKQIQFIPIDKQTQKQDIHNRTSLIDPLSKTQEQLEQEERKAAEEAAKQQEEQDQM